jgi:hypothetical protein
LESGVLLLLLYALAFGHGAVAQFRQIRNPPNAICEVRVGLVAQLLGGLRLASSKSSLLRPGNMMIASDLEIEPARDSL